MGPKGQANRFGTVSVYAGCEPTEPLQLHAESEGGPSDSYLSFSSKGHEGGRLLGNEETANPFVAWDNKEAEKGLRRKVSSKDALGKKTNRPFETPQVEIHPDSPPWPKQGH